MQKKVYLLRIQQQQQNVNYYELCMMMMICACENK